MTYRIWPNIHDSWRQKLPNYIVSRFLESSHLLRRLLGGAKTSIKVFTLFGRLGIGSFPGSLAYRVARKRFNRSVAHNMNNPVNSFFLRLLQTVHNGQISPKGFQYSMNCLVLFSICSGGRVFKFCKCQCVGLCVFYFFARLCAFWPASAFTWAVPRDLPPCSAILPRAWLTSCASTRFWNSPTWEIKIFVMRRRRLRRGRPPLPGPKGLELEANQHTNVFNSGWAAWWHEDLTWLGTSANLGMFLVYACRLVPDMRNC